MKKRAVTSGIALLFIVTACGGEGEATSGTDSPLPTSTQTSSGSGGAIGASGPGLTIAEARATDAEGPLLVRGALVVDGGAARLCERLAESSPPQCGGDSLELVGLDPSAVDGLDRVDGVQWAEQVKLLGELEGDRFVLSETTVG